MVSLSHDGPMGFGLAFVRILEGLGMDAGQMAVKLHLGREEVEAALLAVDMPVAQVLGWCLVLGVPVQTVCGLAYGGCGVSTDAGAVLRRLYAEAKSDHQQSTTPSDANILYGRLCGLAEAYLHLPDAMDMDVDGNRIHKPLGRRPVTYFEAWG
jgi:hypothetical protein